MAVEEKYMRRCLELARKGNGFVAPNPMVGAVIVHDGKIIGEGFHRKWGKAHAEVNAFASVRQPEKLKNSTLYVNLEPCSHYGKTPPCAELIIEKQIPRVVVGQIDPFPEVSGQGIRMLQEAGIEVITNILKTECERLNKRFMTFVLKKRPYIILKWAQSTDGFMDRVREAGNGQIPVKFSDDFTQVLVHKMRAEEAAITVGSRTELLDHPQLNVRHWQGNDPARVWLDSRKTLAGQMGKLYRQGLQSLIVEGGTTLLRSFLEEQLWDEMQIEISPVHLGNGVKAPDVSGVLVNVQKCKKNIFLFYKP